MNRYFVIAGVWLASLATVWVFFPRTKTVVRYEQGQIDESTWVRRSEYETERELARRLKKENKELASKVGDIDQYNRIIAELNLTIDSLANTQVVLVPVEGKIPDTTVVATTTFGNGLMRAESVNRFKDNVFSDQLAVSQLRPLTIDVVTEIDGTYVRTFVSSPDLQDIKLNTYHSMKPKKVKWYHWLGFGFVGGVVTWELLR